MPGHSSCFVFYFPDHLELPGLHALTITDRADAFAFPTVIYGKCGLFISDIMARVVKNTIDYA